jgi:hypothetical protein
MRIRALLLALALTAPVLTTASQAAVSPTPPQSADAEYARQIAEEARREAATVRQNAEEIRRAADVARQDAEATRLTVQTAVAVGAARVSTTGNDGAYSSGHGSLQQRQYQRAISQFDQSILKQSPRADGALYWRAFAQYKLGQSDLALASITQLRRDHTQSRYLADAKVLETEVKRSSGRVPTDDEEIKLLAIQGVQRSAQAVTVLEGVLSGVNSLAVKKRALSALASIDDPRARTVLMNYAKGSGNTDLQIEAIRVLGSRREQPMSDADLRALYTGTSDTTIRLAVVSALASQENADALVTLARAETAVDLKREIVRRLSDLAPRSKVAADFLTGVLK